MLQASRDPQEWPENGSSGGRETKRVGREAFESFDMKILPFQKLFNDFGLKSFRLKSSIDRSGWRCLSVKIAGNLSREIFTGKFSLV